MPLAFESLSHGRISFGFFNIESDMLLLDRLFFFSTDFCACVARLAEGAGEPGEAGETGIAGYAIDDPAAVGDLMGAIHGIEFTGFLGELYRIHPFPRKPEDFRQNPDGTATQEEVRALIERFARPLTIPLFAAGADGTGGAAGADGAEGTEGTEGTNGVSDVADIGGYRFTREAFHELLAYVWRGGYPRWRDDSPPRYVREMRARLEDSGQPLFRGLNFERD